MLAAGRLRHRIRLDALTASTDDDNGERAETWADAFGLLLPAEISPLYGRELIAAQAVQSKVTTKIKLRYRAGVVASMRAVHRGLVYSIEAVVPDPESGVRWMTLFCTSGVSEG